MHDYYLPVYSGYTWVTRLWESPSCHGDIRYPPWQVISDIDLINPYTIKYTVVPDLQETAAGWYFSLFDTIVKQDQLFIT